jgi:cellulose synthase/poly-beta-1,6-N-acetylglucosamine synthase-like glycosyltransferase
MGLIGSILLYGLEALLAGVVGYLLFLTVAAWFAPRQTKLPAKPLDRRFAILIPAHNEERLLPSLLDNLHQLDYPRELYTIHVVADNCTDRTAEIARQDGAVAHERFDTTQLGKGYALEWLIERLWARSEVFDAILILDSDSIISPNFLSVMAARLAGGEEAIQAYYAVRDPAGSWSASLRAIALAALHFLRPLARSVLGASTGLKGNGMVFAADIIKQYRWPASLTEDIEYHMSLILDGRRVTFAPDAVVWAEMPSSLAASQTQNVRWERGRQEMVRNYVPRLLKAAAVRRSFLLLDAAIEQLIPPFSIVAGATVICLLLAGLLQDRVGLWVALSLLAGQAAYTLAALSLSRLPARVYQALLYVPVFIGWKIWLYLRVLVGLDRKGWVRTARNDS